MTLQELRSSFPLGKLSFGLYPSGAIISVQLTHEDGRLIASFRTELVGDGTLNVMCVYVLGDEEGGEQLKSFAEQAGVNVDAVTKVFHDRQMKALTDCI